MILYLLWFNRRFLGSWYIELCQDHQFLCDYSILFSLWSNWFGFFGMSFLKYRIRIYDLKFLCWFKCMCSFYISSNEIDIWLDLTSSVSLCLLVICFWRFDDSGFDNICSIFLHRNQKTFRPKKSAPSGSKVCNRLLSSCSH